MLLTDPLGAVWIDDQNLPHAWTGEVPPDPLLRATQPDADSVWGLPLVATTPSHRLFGGRAGLISVPTSEEVPDCVFPGTTAPLAASATGEVVGWRGDSVFAVDLRACAWRLHRPLPESDRDDSATTAGRSRGGR